MLYYYIVVAFWDIHACSRMALHFGKCMHAPVQNFSPGAHLGPGVVVVVVVVVVVFAAAVVVVVIFVAVVVVVVFVVIVLVVVVVVVFVAVLLCLAYDEIIDR